MGWRPGHEEGAPKGPRGEVVYGPLRGEAGGLYLPFFFWLRFDTRPGGSRPANCWGCNSNSWGFWIKPIVRIIKNNLRRMHTAGLDVLWRADKKLIYQRTRRVTTLLRPPLESSRRGEFRSALSIFVKSIFDLLFFETSENRVPTKIDKADLDSPRQIV